MLSKDNNNFISNSRFVISLSLSMQEDIPEH